MLAFCIRTFSLFLILITAPSHSHAETLPNIIIVYADDLGFGDLSCYNPDSAYQTPRLDQMAAEGIRFTDAHSPSTICSPSRYGLFSGQQIYRSTGRGGGAFEGPGGPSYLKPGTLTLGDMLKEKGYHTGIFGKWHVGLTWKDKDGKQLGNGFENSLLIDYEKSTPLIDGPQARGFDESFVTPNCPTTDPLYLYIENGMVPVPASFRHKRNTLPNLGGKWLWDNDEGWMAPGYEFEKADLLFFDKMQTFITKHRKETPEQPFFAVLSTQICHAPVLPAAEFRGATQAGPRGDFVHELDVLVGRVLDLVANEDLDEDTLILFNTDNGPETMHVAWMREDHDHDPSGGWRGVKRDGWEGGHRVPFIARWPGRIPAGQVSDQMTNTTDIFATLASVVGYSLPDDAATDSFDMLPAMLGVQPHEEFIRPHLLTQSFRGEFQIRLGKWKYLDHKGSGGNDYSEGILKPYQLPETEPESPGQLFDLEADPGETKNLYFTTKSKREELQSLLADLKSSGRSAPLERVPLGMENIPKLAIQKNTPTRPNIVVIMADDLGYMDLHCNGNPLVDTPALDQLAAEGMRFTDAYSASPVCSPTRAAMMTGQSPARIRLTNHAPGHKDGFSLEGSNLQEAESVRNLDLSYVTIAERLSVAGYNNAHIGKWHLSHVDRNSKASITELDLRPEHQGFNLNLGGCFRGGPPSYFSPYKIPALPDGKEGEYLPKRLADEAISFINDNREGPFYLNWWPYSVHYPIQAREDLIAKYSKRKGPGIKDPVYAAMIEGMDIEIGRFLKELDKAGLRDNTVILFKSDNGGYNGDNRPLRGFKGMLYEGGIRIPWIVRWPGKVEAGTVCSTPVISTDCYPTLLEIAGLPPTPNHPIDGTSLIPLLKQSGGLNRDEIFFHYPNYAFHKRNKLGGAVRAGDFKLIKRYGDDSLELYNLSNDIGEKKNLAKNKPKIARQLEAKLNSWLKETEASMPVRAGAN